MKDTPLIILGAGASKGYSSHDLLNYSIPHPPVTQELFSLENINENIAKRYPEVENLISELELRMQSQKGSDPEDLETVLRKLKAEAANEEHVMRQMVALQFYLRDLFEDFSQENFKRMNNYKILINRIQKSESKTVNFVSFNYDSLLEQSIEDSFQTPIKDMKSYMNYMGGRIKIFKLHGSHNWRYIRSIPSPYPYTRTSYSFLREFPNHLEEMQEENSTPYHVEELRHREKEVFQFPAIAIPLANKQNFVIHPEHLNFLSSEIKSTKRILIIGWKAADQLLMEKLKDINSHTEVLVVNGEGGEAEKTVRKKFQEKIKPPPFVSTYNGDFSDFVISKECEKFFGVSV